MKIKRSKYDIAVNLICLILLFGIIIYLGMNWNNISDQIPGHYNAVGEVDRWGKKGELLILPIIGWILYLGLTAAEHFPQIWNTGVAVTEENQEQVYRILKNMIGTIKLLMAAVFVFLSVNSASAKKLPVWFLPVFLILMLGSSVFFIIKLRRAR